MATQQDLWSPQAENRKLLQVKASNSILQSELDKHLTVLARQMRSEIRRRNEEVETVRGELQQIKQSRYLVDESLKQALGKRRVDVLTLRNERAHYNRVLIQHARVTARILLTTARERARTYHQLHRHFVYHTLSG